MAQFGYRGSEESRFWSKVSVSPTLVYSGTFCWMWLAHTNEKGYGRFRCGSKMVAAHRWAYEYCIGPIGQNLTIDHLCRNHSCVNPWHMEPVRNVVNGLRGNSLFAINSGKLFCIRGHPLTGENLARDKNGFRHCRTCARIWHRNWWRRNLSKYKHKYT